MCRPFSRTRPIEFNQSQSTSHEGPQRRSGQFDPFALLEAGATPPPTDFQRMLDSLSPPDQRRPASVSTRPSPPDSRRSTPYPPGGFDGRVPPPKPLSSCTSTLSQQRTPTVSSSDRTVPPVLSLKPSAPLFIPSPLTSAALTSASPDSGRPSSGIWTSYTPISSVQPPFSDSECSSSPVKTLNATKPSGGTPSSSKSQRTVPSVRVRPPVRLNWRDLVEPPAPYPLRSVATAGATSEHSARSHDVHNGTEVQGQFSSQATAQADAHMSVVVTTSPPRSVATSRCITPPTASEGGTAGGDTGFTKLAHSPERLDVKAPIFVPKHIVHITPDMEHSEWLLRAPSSSDGDQTVSVSASEESTCKIPSPMSTSSLEDPRAFMRHDLRSPSPRTDDSMADELLPPAQQRSSSNVAPPKSVITYDSLSARSVSSGHLDHDPVIIKCNPTRPSSMGSPSPCTQPRTFTPIIPPRTDSTRPPSANSSVPSLRAGTCRHPEFYIQDEMKVLEVEDTLFRVHRYILEQDSDYMRDLLRSETPRGTTEDDAIVLPAVSCSEFECLLRFLYHRIPGVHSTAVCDLLSMLSVSTRLSYTKLRDHAIAQLEVYSLPLDPIERIMLAEKHGVRQWLVPASLRCASVPDDRPAEETKEGLRSAFVQQ
ncbi:hypothetical protein CERSUDRAFT_88899 [Gelatoporia subvermispora B]|uniref:BTB domain-containing protein n=1 Tax=Ceriporiopsis subvermispora (strain B) TaxID=914234 RepID=M2P8L6_CERS8|nr:hypothetical protein CERSUDRAFT_88899 [Gelatoporia subvermispora B]